MQLCFTHTAAAAKYKHCCFKQATMQASPSAHPNMRCKNDHYSLCLHALASSKFIDMHSYVTRRSKACKTCLKLHLFCLECRQSLKHCCALQVKTIFDRSNFSGDSSKALLHFLCLIAICNADTNTVASIVIGGNVLEYSLKRLAYLPKSQRWSASRAEPMCERTDVSQTFVVTVAAFQAVLCE